MQIEASYSLSSKAWIKQQQSFLKSRAQMMSVFLFEKEAIDIVSEMWELIYFLLELRE